MLMKYVMFIVMSMFTLGCSNSKSYTAQEDRAYQQLKELVASQNFEVTSHTARPMASTAFIQVTNSNILGLGNSATNINLIGNANSLKVMGDTIKAYLPFYGEQFFGGNPGINNNGIEFNDMPEDYQVKLNDSKHIVEISFKIRDEFRGNERYDINMTLFPNNTSTINVQSTSRSNIEFLGNVKSLSEEAIGR